MKILNYRCLLDPKCDFYAEAATQEGLDEFIADHMEKVNNHVSVPDQTLDNLDKTTPVHMNVPAWMAEALDAEAQYIGIPRTNLIKIILRDHIKNNH